MVTSSTFCIGLHRIVAPPTRIALTDIWLLSLDASGKIQQRRFAIIPRIFSEILTKIENFFNNPYMEVLNDINICVTEDF